VTESPTNLEGLRRYLAGGGRSEGWHKTVGATIAQVEAGRVVVELATGPRHQHDWGMVQGGIITAVADAAMGLAILTRQAPGQANVTAELKINFIRPVREGVIRAVGTVVSMDDDAMFSQAEVFDPDGRLVAKASSTCLAIASPALGGEAG